MLKNSQNGFIKFLTVLLLILKVRFHYSPWKHVLTFVAKIPTFLAFGNLLRERRTQHGFGSLNIRGGDVSGPTSASPSIHYFFHLLLSTHTLALVWSMPGGFTSGGRDGYQSVGDEPAAQPAAPKPVPASHSVAPPGQPANPVAPGSYQNV